MFVHIHAMKENLKFLLVAIAICCGIGKVYAQEASQEKSPENDSQPELILDRPEDGFSLDPPKISQ